MLILEHKGYMFDLSLTAGLFRFFGRHIASSKLGITMTPRSPLRGGGGGADLSWSEFQNPYICIEKKAMSLPVFYYYICSQLRHC